MKKLTAFRLAWTAIVVAATSLPYLLNWFATPAGYHYTWIIPPYPEDSFGYMAWAQQAAHGAWLFTIKYTALPHEAFLFHPFFLFSGWMSALFSGNIGVVFLVMKAIGVVLFFVAFYAYVDFLGLDPIQSTAASVLVGVSSGLGGILAFLGLVSRSLAPDVWLPDMSTYWSLLWNALFPFSLTLMLLSIYWLDRGTREARSSDLWLAGLATGVMALIHPYSLPLLFALAVVVTVIRRRANAFGYLCRYFALALPFVTYVTVVSQINPLVARHSALGEMKSPSLVAYVLGFGLPLFFCLAALIAKWTPLFKRYYQLVLWFFLSVVFAYLPFWFQRKLVFGAHVPLCILDGIAFAMLLGWCSRSTTRTWVVIIAAVIGLPLLVATPIYLFDSQRKKARANADGAYYLSNEKIEGLRFLNTHSDPNDVVFATIATSRLIPAFAGNTVVWGHWAMSIDLKERRAWLGDLLKTRSNWDDENRSREFWGTGIQYIFADGEIKQALETYPFMWRVILKEAEKVFENDSVVIYRRRKAS